MCVDTLVVDQELGCSGGSDIQQDVYTVGNGQIDGGKSSLPATDYSPVYNIITFTDDDQRIRAVSSAGRRQQPAELHVRDGRGRFVDGEINEGCLLYTSDAADE